MFDENGQIIPDEIFAGRCENEMPQYSEEAE